MPSAAIADFKYDEEARELTVIFISGRGYVYLDVPPEENAGLEAAASKGGYVNAHIRDRYEFRELI